MKSFTAVAVFGLVAAVHAQSQCASVAAQIPGCATKCIASAAAGVGCSSPTDFACQCKNTAAINAAALQCVLSGCGATTGLQVQASASAVCNCVASAGPASSSAPASAATVAPAITSKAASSAASTPATSHSAPYPSSGATQIADGQIQATGAAAPTATPKTAGNSTAPFTGAGTQVVASVGGLLAALAAAVAAL